MCRTNDWHAISARLCHTIEWRAISARHVRTNEWRAVSLGHVVVDVTSRRARLRSETIVDNGLRGRWRNTSNTPTHSLCVTTKQMYNKIKYARENTTNYLVRFFNSQKANMACNKSLITRIVKAHGTKILFPLYTTGFDTFSDDVKKEAETDGEEILCKYSTLKTQANKDSLTWRSVSRTTTSWIRHRTQRLLQWCTV